MACWLLSNYPAFESRLILTQRQLCATCGQLGRTQRPSKRAHCRLSLRLHIGETGSQPRASAFFKLSNSVCRCSECRLPALNVEMCMAQHLSLSAATSPLRGGLLRTTAQTAACCVQRLRTFIAIGEDGRSQAAADTGSTVLRRAMPHRPEH
jgi:hypothetical protein